MSSCLHTAFTRTSRCVGLSLRRSHPSPRAQRISAFAVSTPRLITSCTASVSRVARNLNYATAWRQRAVQLLKFASRKQFTTNHTLKTAPQDELHSKTTTTPSRPNHDGARSGGFIVTGGTSGIGFEVVKKAINAGASHVRIITRHAQSGQKAVERLLREISSDDVTIDYVEAQPEDYADPRLFQFAGAKESPFQIVVHCAGIAQTSLLSATHPENIRKILDVNLVSAALLSKSLLKSYLKACMSSSQQKRHQLPPSVMSKSWQFITISSLLAEKGGVGSSIYAASKAGLTALTRAVALEGAEISQRYSNNNGRGFRANVVVPGYIETPMTSNFSLSHRDKLLKAIPARRFGKADEVAGAVMFLYENEYANNCVLNLDGGLSAV